MCSGTIWSSFWPNPRMASSGMFCCGSMTLPNVLAAGRGRSIGTASPTPQSATPLSMASQPTSTASWAKGMLQLRVNTWVRSPPQRSPPKFSIGSVVCGGTHSVLFSNCESRVTLPACRAMLGRQHLERRARHVALLVGVGEQRIAGRGLQEREHRLGLVEVGVDDEVGVVGREAPHRLDGAGRRVHHDHRPLAIAERVLGDLLQVVADRRAHRARVVAAAGDQPGQGAQLLLGRGPGEHVVLRPLELGGAEGERVVAGDVGVQVAGRVLPLVLEVGAGRVGDRLGDDGAVGREDLAARLVELAADGAGVVERRLELLLAPDLPVVEGDEQRDVADHQPQASWRICLFMASPATQRPAASADPRRGAAATPPSARRASGRSGSSWRRRAPESLSRISSAMRM